MSRAVDTVIHRYICNHAVLSALPHVTVQQRADHAMQADLERVKVAGDGNVDITVGSALDIFGGDLPFQAVVDWHRLQREQM